MQAALEDGSVLTLKMIEPGWMQPAPGRLTRMLFVRKMDDLIPDHDHLMHLYAIRQPGLDVVYHLHPELVSSGLFRLPLPSMPAGTYELYADIVHANGFSETMVASIEVPAISGRALAGDDASAVDTPWRSRLPVPYLTYFRTFKSAAKLALQRRRCNWRTLCSVWATSCVNV
jgi:hypothetical protein